MKASWNYNEKTQGYRLILGYMGVLLMIIGGITLLPLLTLLFYPQESHEAPYFILPGVIAIILGYLLYFSIRGKKQGRLERNQDALIVVGCWILAVVVTSMPFVIQGHYNVSQAIFEATSGWSTTGLSVVDVEHTSHLFLVHRSTILFFGGIGLVLIMVSVLSDSYGMRLYHAEGHNDRLLPNLLKSARIIVTIYFCYICAGSVLYVLFGMPVFDAIIHSIGALSTGGFSSQTDSIGTYNSSSIEMITIVLMILGNINFLAHLFLIRGKFHNFFHYCEIKFQLLVIVIATPIIAFILVYSIGWLGGTSFRIAIFQTISALTTTGFQTVKSFQALPSAILMLMIVLQLIGGGSGSTAGGMKQYRVYIMIKSVYWHIKRLFYSHKLIVMHKVWKVEKKEKISQEEISNIGIYVFLYICLFFFGSFLLSCFGYSLQDSMFEFSSALSTVGLSVGIMNYDAPTIVLWIGTIGMFIGRLEIYVVLLALLRGRKDIAYLVKNMKNRKADKMRL